MAAPQTRDALLEQGALLFARHGVTGVTTRQLHEAVGARNESAVHYHFGGRRGLVAEIIRMHLEAVEARRALLVATIAAGDRSGDLRAVMHALVAPMAEDLDTELGRAHLRLAAELSHPSLAYEPAFQQPETPSGRTVGGWLVQALDGLPRAVRRERLAVLRGQLISLMAQRAKLLDERPDERDPRLTELFVHNLIDMVVAGLEAPPSEETLEAGRAAPGR